ncbi:MAG: hypothetical protein SFU85_12435 [Candidatus Methylacidiphilales bacterium]|nr:hypothetical protein [Candidatus Methylacidiphilales bacterium]
MKLPLSEINFSVPGAYLGLGPDRRIDPLAVNLRRLHDFSDPRDVLGFHLLRPEDGTEIPFEAHAVPGCLRLQARGEEGRAEVRFTFASEREIRVWGRACVLRARHLGQDMEPLPGLEPWTRRRFHPSGLTVGFGVHLGTLHAGEGEMLFQPDSAGGFEGGLWEDAGESAGPAMTRAREFEDLRECWKNDFETWSAPLLEGDIPEEFAEAARKAAYILWSFQVEPRGYIRRPALYMSKNWMTSVWSWDNCFNALALAPHHPELAWDQFMLFFDHQREDGQCPDFLSPRQQSWGMTKPPLYGWVLARLRALHPFFRSTEISREIYPHLKKQVEWWFKHRDADQDGLPEYHHGCECGWDNATCFDDSNLVGSPDLLAWMVAQMRMLAVLADELGLAGDGAQHWNARAEALKSACLEHFWVDGAWRTRTCFTRELPTQGDSLLPHLAILLADEWPEAVNRGTLASLSDPERFLSPCGFATESRASALYQADSYWRGPVWAPVMDILVYSLRQIGDRQTADRAALGYCRACATHGFAENHDAVDGRGWRDPAYTWTASVFLILLRNLLGSSKRS